MKEVLIAGLQFLLLSSVKGSERVLLWPDAPPNGKGAPSIEKAYFTVSRPPTPSGAVIVFCSGGAYASLANLGDAPPLFELLKPYGVTLVTLEYRLPRGNSEIALLDAQRMLRYVRFHANEWKRDPKRVGIMGLSAGGHLAAMAATCFDDGNPKSIDSVERMSCRPDFAILIAPVITMGEKTHADSRKNLLGENPTPEEIQRYSTETRVTENTCPCFLAHAQDDGAVSPINSQMFYDALLSKKVPAEYLKVTFGGHEMTYCRTPHWDGWKDELVDWMKKASIIEIGFAR